MSFQLSSLASLLLLSVVLFPAARAAEPPRADAGPRVGQWGEVMRLEFHGLRTFASNDVVNALLQSPDFLLAAHPAAPRSEFAPALQKALVAGYRSALELAEELERFLNCEPILALPSGDVRKLWNWAQKNPWVFAAGFGARLPVMAWPSSPSR